MWDPVPLQLATMAFNNIEIKIENSAKFLGVIIDENLTWKNHIGVSDLLDFKNLLKIHFSFLHIYISFANIAWTSTFKTKLKGILKKQKHGARIPFHANRSDCSRPLLKVMKALNVYEINLIQTLKFMRKTKHGINLQIFLPKFREKDRHYLTRFSQKVCL